MRNITKEDIIKNANDNISKIENDPVYFAKILPSAYNMYKFKNKKYNVSKTYSIRAFEKFLNLTFNKCFTLRNKLLHGFDVYAFKCVNGEFFVRRRRHDDQKYWCPCRLLLLFPPHNSCIKFTTGGNHSYTLAGLWFNLSKHNGVRYTDMIVFDDEDSMELYLELNNI